MVHHNLRLPLNIFNTDDLMLEGNGTTASAQSSSFVNKNGAGGFSHASTTSADGQTRTSSQDVYTPGATSSHASAQATSNPPDVTTSVTTNSSPSNNDLHSEADPMDDDGAESGTNESSATDETGLSPPLTSTNVVADTNSSSVITGDASGTTTGTAVASVTTSGQTTVTSQTVSDPNASSITATSQASLSNGVETDVKVGSTNPAERAAALTIGLLPLPSIQKPVVQRTIRITSARSFNQGSAKAEKIIGNGDRNRIRGKGGDDLVIARGGHDRVSGNRGNDMIRGGGGNDKLGGGFGDDLLLGGSGDDRLCGQAGDDVMDGGKGNDDLIGGAGRNVMTGGKGADVFHLESSTTVIAKATVITDFSRTEGDRIRLKPNIDTAQLTFTVFDSSGDGVSNATAITHNTIILGVGLNTVDAAGNTIFTSSHFL